MKIKTNDLKDKALDWAVAVCEAPIGGYKPWVQEDLDKGILHGMRYSSDWLWGGPIIEREGIDILRLRTNINNDVEDRGWRAYHTPTRDAVTHCYAEGPTPLTAAMRCFVSSKLGDEVEIPEELT